MKKVCTSIGTLMQCQNIFENLYSTGTRMCALTTIKLIALAFLSYSTLNRNVPLNCQHKVEEIIFFFSKTPKQEPTLCYVNNRYLVYIYLVYQYIVTGNRTIAVVLLRTTYKCLPPTNTRSKQPSPQ